MAPSSISGASRSPSETSQNQQSSTALHLFEMGGGPGSGPNRNDEREEPIALLALKMGGILVIKTVKDLFNYPPMLLDDYSRKQQSKQIPEGELPKTNPFVLLAKFMGVLAFKTVHDAVYYPALWTKEAMNPKNNYDEYYY